MNQQNNPKEWDGHWGSKETIDRLKTINTAYREVVKALLDITNENSKCIELGCGSGTYAIELLANNRNCIASDFSQDALDLAKAKGKALYNLDVPVELVDVYNIPYPENTFDLIFSDGVIEHLDIPKALKEMERALKPGGWMVAKVPSGSLLYKLVFHLLSPIEHRPFEAWFPKNKWKQMAEECGYINVNVSYCGSILKGFLKRIKGVDKAAESLPELGKIYFLIKAQKKPLS